MRRTPFYDVHVASGAKMVNFGGYAMPVQYAGIIEEHAMVRNSAGIFDVSHMGEIEVRGQNAEGFVQRLTLNDVKKLYPGRAQYSAMAGESGGLIDDLLVYDLGDAYMLVVNAANLEKDLAWIKKQADAFGGVEIRNVSDRTALIAVQGPASIDVLQRLTNVDLSAVKFYHFQKGTLAGTEMILSRTGYTGEPGFELYYDASSVDNAAIWSTILEAGKKEGVGPAGLGARDTLRLEMGMLLYGNDIDETTNPLEARLGWITKLEKGDFIGRDALLRIQREGIGRKLTGLTAADPAAARRTIPRSGYPILDSGKEIGRVTSGTFSPTLQTGIALAYVSTEYAQPGRHVSIGLRGREAAFIVTEPPFLKR
jgi:aminomethyltransferase